MSYVALDIFQQLRQEDIHWMLASCRAQDDLGQRRTGARGRSLRDHLLHRRRPVRGLRLRRLRQRLKVGQLGPGEIIGEISWLDRKPISATVRALETSSVHRAQHRLARAQARRATRGLLRVSSAPSPRWRPSVCARRRPGAPRPSWTAAQRPQPGPASTAAASSTRIASLKKPGRGATGGRRQGRGDMPTTMLPQDPQGVRRHRAERRHPGSCRTRQARRPPCRPSCCRSCGSRPPASGTTPSPAAMPATTRPSRRSTPTRRPAPAASGRCSTAAC